MTDGRPTFAAGRHPAPARGVPWQRAGFGLLAGLAALLALPFVLHAIGFGWRGLSRELSGETYLFTPDGPVPNGAIFTHMLLGGLLTLLVPLQLVGPLRRRARAFHRWAGRGMAAAASSSRSSGSSTSPPRHHRRRADGRGVRHLRPRARRRCGA